MTPTEVDAFSPGDLLEGLAVERLDIAGLVLPDLSIEECVVERLSASEADLRGLRLRESVIQLLDAAVLRASRSAWSDVRVESGRVGSAELYDSRLNSVCFAHMKFGYLNLRAASVSDVVFDDCLIDELDIASAELRRVAFPGTRIRTISGRPSRLAHFDLRGADLSALTAFSELSGATLSTDQLMLVAPALAEAAGLIID